MTWPATLAVVFIMLAFAMSLMIMATQPAAAEAWRGEVDEKDGVKWISNPEQAPGAIRDIELRELWRIGGETDNDDEFFGVIDDLMVDESGNVYLLDKVLNVVKIFSSDGDFVREIGREGEGPGEFRDAEGMAFLPGGLVGVMVGAPGRIVLIEREGLPAGEHPMPSIEGVDMVTVTKADSDGVRPVLAFGFNLFEQGTIRQPRLLASIASDGSLLTTFAATERGIDFAAPIFKETEWDDFENRWDMGDDGWVFVANTWGEYKVAAWSPAGELAHMVTRKLSPRKRTGEELDRLRLSYEPALRNVPGSTAEVQPMHHPVMSVYALEAGRFMVLNCHGAYGRADGSLGRFDVYDAHGRLEGEVELLGEGTPRIDGYYFEGERLYVLRGQLDAEATAQGGLDKPIEGEEPAPMSLICYSIPAKI